MNNDHTVFGVVGLKQVMRGLNAGELDKIFLAEDADAAIREQIMEQCEECHIDVVDVPDMDKLGKMAGIDVGAAVAGSLKADTDL